MQLLYTNTFECVEAPSGLKAATNPRSVAAVVVGQGAAVGTPTPAGVGQASDTGTDVQGCAHVTGGNANISG